MAHHISREERLSRQGVNANRGQVRASQAQGGCVRRSGGAAPATAMRPRGKPVLIGILGRCVAGTVSAGSADIFPILGEPSDMAGV
jgi:hypothetical protein